MAIIGAMLGGIIGFFLDGILSSLIGGYRMGQPRGRKGQFITEKDAFARRLLTAAICGLIGAMAVPV